MPAPLARAFAVVRGESYLVGGAVRDLLLGRPIKDWDVVSRQACALAKAVAREAKRPCLRLHEEPLTLRVPLAEQISVDIVQLGAEGLRAELARRDFTVNALALAVASGELLDWVGGLRDLEARLLRATGPTVLTADPARLIRAYRLAAELGFKLAPGTRRLIRAARDYLGRAASQRWGLELLKLLDAVGPAAKVLGWMEADGLLDKLLPAAAEMRDLEQGGYHHLDVLRHTLAAVGAADRLLAAPERYYPRSAPQLTPFLGSASARAKLRAAALLHDIGKPRTRQVDPAGRIRFLGHAELGKQLAETTLLAWGWPRTVRVAVARLVELHMRPLTLARESVGQGTRPTDRALRRLAREAGEVLPALFLLAAADLAAARGPSSSRAEQRALLRQMDEMLARIMARPDISAPRRLLTGHDLMRALGLSPGPQVGQLLRALQEAQDAGEVNTPEEALSLARQRLAQSFGSSADTSA
jgi:putative nucleotidyltransferase with HDIG domain